MIRDDFERVLMNIAIDTARSFLDNMVMLKGGWSLCTRFGSPSPQFMPIAMADSIGMPLKNGDIVKCQTNPNHHWGISVFLEKIDGGWFLQEIGGEKKLRMLNEDLYVLRFMNPSRLYTGHKYRVYNWASGKAFSKRYNSQFDYFKRCGGVDFDEDNLIIWSRSHVWIAEKMVDGKRFYAQPRKFVMKWDKNIRLKDIVYEMQKQGFGLEFEYSEEEPKSGTCGYVKITKEDLDKMFCIEEID